MDSVKAQNQKTEQMPSDKNQLWSQMRSQKKKNGVQLPINRISINLHQSTDLCQVSPGRPKPWAWWQTWGINITRTNLWAFLIKWETIIMEHRWVWLLFNQWEWLLSHLWEWFLSRLWEWLQPHLWVLSCRPTQSVLNQCQCTLCKTNSSRWTTAHQLIRLETGTETRTETETRTGRGLNKNDLHYKKYYR